MSSLGQNQPSILVIPRLDELWTYIDIGDQVYLTAALEDIHAGLPILIIATCEDEIPLTVNSQLFLNRIFTF